MSELYCFVLLKFCYRIELSPQFSVNFSHKKRIFIIFIILTYSKNGQKMISKIILRSVTEYQENKIKEIIKNLFNLN